ncbi:threonine aldolase family protein [Pimelobacter simplex]|nr:GntG family PLP-dependent aldolase [Pimelobacter simplex]
MLDLRSDTGTRPSPAMRRAMAEAEVGDDVYGDDPTVNDLQRACAALLGKEAALFVPSGSMGNLVAIAAQCGGRGDGVAVELLCDTGAHVLNHEGGGLGLLPLTPCALPAPGGVVPADVLAARIRAGDDHAPRTALLSVEITHTSLGGTVPDRAAYAATAQAARERGVAVHVDGARLFNAVVASGVSAAQWADPADTVSICFSKGLGAPAGAMVAGRAEVVERARLWRKRLGGAMRQTGVLAAAAAVALDEGPAHLAEDHARAAWLATTLAERFPGSVDPADVHTNIVHVACGPLGVPAPVLVPALTARGLLTKAYDDRTLRLVTHRDLAPGDPAAAVDLLTRVIGELT